jgi:hypothetical protein
LWIKNDCSRFRQHEQVGNCLADGNIEFFLILRLVQGQARYEDFVVGVAGNAIEAHFPIPDLVRQRGIEAVAERRVAITRQQLAESRFGNIAIFFTSASYGFCFCSKKLAYAVGPSGVWEYHALNPLVQQRRSTL